MYMGIKVHVRGAFEKYKSVDYNSTNIEFKVLWVYKYKLLAILLYILYLIEI